MYHYIMPLALSQKPQKPLGGPLALLSQKPHMPLGKTTSSDITETTDTCTTGMTGVDQLELLSQKPQTCQMPLGKTTSSAITDTTTRADPGFPERGVQPLKKCTHGERAPKAGNSVLGLKIQVLI
jgi:hypothetical protein